MSPSKKSKPKAKKSKISSRCWIYKLLAFTVILVLALLAIGNERLISKETGETTLLARLDFRKDGNIVEEIQSIFYEKEEKVKKVEHDSLRGIYLTAYTVSTAHFHDLIDALISSGGNMVVMDVEVSGGKLAFVPENPYLASINPGSTTIPNIKEVVDQLHEKDIYVIARQVIFNDPYTAGVKPEWRIHYKNGALFDYRWIDPSHPEAQEYNLLITKELAALGFDEVQYDYIRFPAENHSNLEYYFDETIQEPWEIINDFVAEAHTLTQELDIKLGMDIFGAAVWGPIDWQSVGQNVSELAKNVDAIYPMTYPSHVNPGYYGFQNPWGDPGSFVKGSIQKFVEASAGNAEIRTWVQGFPLKATNFGDWYMQDQVRGTYEAGANDFVVWSPGNIYTYSWSSMGLIPPETPIFTEEEIDGAWQSTEDELSSIEFKKGIQISSYNNEVIDSTPFSINKNKLSLSDDMHYQIIELTDTNLELIYLSNGNTMKYLRSE